MRKNTEIYCNACGRRIEKKGEVLQEDILHVEKSWGYFSKKDTEHHTFDLCEECYDKFIQTFVVPIQTEEDKELL